MRRETQAVIFDFDGTLVDSSRLILRTFNCVLQEHGLQALDSSQVLPLIGRPLEYVFQQVFGEDLDVRPYVQSYVGFSRRLGIDEIRLFPDAAEAIRRLSGKLRLGIATARTVQSVNRIIGHLQIDPFFSAVVGVDEVARPKPDPESVHLALKRLGMSAQETILVGDTPYDVMAAKGADVFAVGISTGHFPSDSLSQAGADLTVGSLEEFVDWLQP